VLFDQLLETRLAVVDVPDREPGRTAATQIAEWLDDEADNLGQWPRELWHTLESREPLGLLVYARPLEEQIEW
jgi:hypothetical protein